MSKRDIKPASPEAGLRYQSIPRAQQIQRSVLRDLSIIACLRVSFKETSQGGLHPALFKATHYRTVRSSETGQVF